MNTQQTPILNIQGWFDFQDIYAKMIQAAPREATLIEIGVWKGASLVSLGLMAKQADKDLRIIGIDRWVHDEWDGYAAIFNVDRAYGQKLSIRQQCELNLAAAELTDRVQLIESHAIAAADLFADRSVFFVFMDDHHTSDHIQREITAWLPKITRPGWLAGHDFPGDIEAGVRKHFPKVEHRGNSWVQEVSSQ